ncbi:MAG: TolC family protein [Bacteroidota bacterium]
MKFRLLIAIFFINTSVGAQMQFNSLQELLNYADANAIAIQAATMSEKVALAGKKETTADLLPTVNASLGYNDNITLQPTLVPAQMFDPEAPEGTFEEFTFGTKYNYSRSVQAQWDVLNFQKIFAVQTANIEIEKSKLNTEVNKFNVYNSLASTYYSILLTEASIRIYEENLRVSTSIYELAKGKYQDGIISEAEVNQAAIKKLQNQRNLNLVKSNLDQFYLQLQSQLNTRKEIRVSDSLDKFRMGDAVFSNAHPEVLLQELEVKKSQSILKQKKALRYPSLSLVYQNNKNWATNDFMDFSGANELPQQLFGVQVSMSGLLSRSTKQKIKQSEWELGIQQMQLANTLLVKQKEDELLQLQLKQAADQLAENEEILSLQEQNDVHAENRYENGIIGLDERLNKYDDLLAAQNNYLESLASLTIAQYKTYIRQINFETSSNK